MLHSSEFDFFSEILRDLQLIFRVIQTSEDVKLLFSGFLQPIGQNKSISFSNNFQDFSTTYQEKTIYHIQNFRFHFLLVKLPAKRAGYLAIGPYLLPDIPCLPQFTAPENLPMEIPTLDDDRQLLSIVSTFLKRIFHDQSTIPVKTIKIPETSDIAALTENFAFHPHEDPLSTILKVENYYDNENELMKLVSQGQWRKADNLLKAYFDTQSPSHAYPGDSTLKTQIIQCFALNTLLRKSAESVDVHPIHIENLSHQLIIKITQINSQKEIHNLQREIVRKYCHLVQIHSLKRYSPIIQKVLTHITSNLSGDLSLNEQANLLNINPSYLSALFKKETGSTLTEYVQQKRINHAIFLLTTTNLQIQTIAECCGISDVNYFTKIFKRKIGKTPKEYRDSILQ